MTVERTPLRPFEEDIIARFRAGGKWYASPKGEWIRGHLLHVKADYPYRMWRLYSAFCEALEINPGTYGSFRTFIFILKSLGLIYPIRREKGPKGFPRSYYAIVPAMEGSPMWRRAMQVAYPSVDWTKFPEERKRAIRARYR